MSQKTKGITEVSVKKASSQHLGAKGDLGT